MGFQQLLLILLGTIVVIIAIVIGINLFATSAVETNRDQLISDLNYLSADAQAYYKKQTEYGGGGQSFTGWEFPEYFKNYEAGKIKAKIKKKGNEVKITATGTEIGMDGKKIVKIEVKVKPTSITIKIKN
ncbi:MAG: hypothetical protein IH950_08640 [Bacteroidetes bacterium]|nr:hypothetical protein [Bacteroidota bacterium]MCH8033803.1 hypothetical protein [Bacteroidota bacterium]